MKNLEENKYYIWLANINISVNIKILLLKEYKNPINIFNATKKELEYSLYIKNKIQDVSIKEGECVRKKIIKQKTKENLRQENIKENILNELTNEYYKLNLEYQIEKMKKFNVKVVTYNDKEYPQQLKYINDFPICLFYKGNAEILNKDRKIAIIRM